LGILAWLAGNCSGWWPLGFRWFRRRHLGLVAASAELARRSALVLAALVLAVAVTIEPSRLRSCSDKCGCAAAVLLPFVVLHLRENADLDRHACDELAHAVDVGGSRGSRGSRAVAALDLSPT
jgi:hypothetical protein